MRVDGLELIERLPACEGRVWQVEKHGHLGAEKGVAHARDGRLLCVVRAGVVEEPVEDVFLRGRRVNEHALGLHSEDDRVAAVGADRSCVVLCCFDFTSGVCFPAWAL